MEKEILALPEYAAQDSYTKRDIGEILKRIKQIPIGIKDRNRLYYLTKLKVALTTPFKGAAPPPGGSYGCSPAMDAQNRAEVEHALREQSYMIWRPDDTELEVSKGKKFSTRVSDEQNKIFLVDRTNPKNILVKVKVKLNGAPNDVEKIQRLEPDIQRAASAPGYRVDISFVDYSAGDVLEFSVNFCEWPNSGNWATGPMALSHELHHALNLGDRYDYIESHANNQGMDVKHRIIWFLEQVKKGAPSKRDQYSKMSEEWRTLLSEDICNIAFDPTSPGLANCLKLRKPLDPKGITPR